MDSRPKVAVIGSINADIVVEVVRLPHPGETLLATGSHRSAGGKGGNQAVGAARAGGARTWFLGCVGDDGDGASLRAGLVAAGVDDSCLHTVPGVTGCALITVDERGENTIIVAAGANRAITSTPEGRLAVGAADAVLAQLEIPQAVVAELASARRPGVPFILNGSPAAPLEPELEAQIDVLLVNEHEASLIAGDPDLDAAIAKLARRFPKVLVTLGAAGSVLAQRGTEPVRVESPRVDALDAVGAGDTYAGALAAALGAGRSAVEAMQFASAAASISVERPGAQESIPTRAEALARAAATYA